MQQNKGNIFFTEIDEKYNNEPALVRMFTKCLGQFNLTYINKELNRTKKHGYGHDNILKVLFLIPFLGIKNINCLFVSGYQQEFNAKKDVFYSFLNNGQINWRKIVTLFARQLMRIIKKNSVDLDGPASPKCLILDDSILAKTGKYIELIGKVFDHCSYTYILGMKLLTLGYWDGKSFFPLDFSLHNEPGKTKKRGLRDKDLAKQFKGERDMASPGAKRVAEITKTKVEMAIEMVKMAIKNCFDARYVLADSWFISEGFINSIKSIKNKGRQALDVIGLMKTDRNLVIEGKAIKASKVAERYHKRKQKSRAFKCSYISLPIEYKGIKMKGFFVCMNGQQNWKLLITTDKSLGFTKAMKYYQIRWSIEVFFKDAKQNLYLGRCQSTCLDAHIATISLCFINYMVLALSKRFSSYESLGQMFRALKNELLEDNLVEKIWKFISELLESFLSDLGIDWEVVMKKMINSEDIAEKIKNTFGFLFTPNAKPVVKTM